MPRQHALDPAPAVATTAQPAAPSLDYPPANLAGNSRQATARVPAGELVGGWLVGDEPAKPQRGSREWAERILSRTPATKCPRSRHVLVHIQSGRSFSVLCKSWACPYCQRRKWVAVAKLLQDGIERAWLAGERVRFVTLTDASEDGMTVAELSAAWDKLAKLLKRGGPAPPRPAAGSGASAQAAWRAACRQRTPYVDAYAMVLEVGNNGSKQLHAHVLMTGRYVYQADLSRWAQACGFGRVVDVREVKRGDAEEVAGYAAKQLASYASKTGQALALQERSEERLRPLRVSRGWYGGGLRAAEEALGIRSPKKEGGSGSWFILTHDDARGFVRAEPL